MPTNIGAIKPRQRDFRTQANADWYDGLPIVCAGNGGIEPGSANIGNGALVISAIDPDVPFGAHVITVSAAGAIARYTVESPDGNVSGAGVTGLPIYAGGITMALSQGTVPFALGDVFAISILPTPVDTSGLNFIIQARDTVLNANVALYGTSDTSNPNTVQQVTNSGATGIVGLAFDHDSQSWQNFSPKATPYLYDVIAIDPETGRVAVAYYGAITHEHGVSLIP